MIQQADCRIEAGFPEYYVNLCARRYAEMSSKLFLATEHERTQTKMRLSYILAGGLIEYQREFERRLRRHPDDAA